jgi:hypothetical protein
MQLQLVLASNDVLEITLNLYFKVEISGTAGQMAMLNFEQENHD